MTLSFEHLCNQIVHSYVFVAFPDKGEVFFSSDQFFKEVLYRAQVATYLELVEAVYYDEIGWFGKVVPGGEQERRGIGWDEINQNYSRRF